MLASLTLLLLPSCAIAQEPATGLSDRDQRLLERREKELEEAEQARDLAYSALTHAYQQSELAWADESVAISAEIRAWLMDQDLRPADWPHHRDRLRAKQTFFSWWNEELYLISPAAAEYSVAIAELEEAFMKVERLRHPQRFAEGFEETPPGMVLVAEGTFPIGPHFGRIDGFPQSEERRERKVRSFYLDRHEVTCTAYLEFLLAQPPGLRQQHVPLDWEVDQNDLPVIPTAWEDRPVVGVAWNSAAAFARWAGKRLPTELEWEAAAAGREGRTYARAQGFDAERINCQASGKRGVMPVLDFAEDRTPLGILGLAGNAAEWTADLWVSPLQTGKRAKQVDQAGDDAEAVVRGGSYLASAEGCRNTYRTLYPALGRAYRHIGFRCAQDLP